jgi:MFS family permease
MMMKRYLSLLRQRDFCWLTAADAISVFGDQIGIVALLWFVMITTGQSFPMGLLGLCLGLPGVLLGTVAGNLLDRWPRKTVLVMANILMGILFLGIYLCAVSHLPAVTWMMGIILAGCLLPFLSTGWMVMLPQVVAKEDLGSAHSLTETFWQAASLLGPFIGGIWIATWGAPATILLDGFSFWGAAWCLSRIKEAPEWRGPEESRIPRSSFWTDYWENVRAGWTSLYSAKAVVWITLGGFFLNMAYGLLEVVLPLFVHRECLASPAVLGSLWMAYFTGAIGGSVASGFVRFPFRQGWLMSLMIIGWGTSFLPMVWMHSLPAAFLSMALAGFLFAGYSPMARAAVQRIIPSAYHGRVFGLRTAIIGCGAPSGSFLGSFFAQWMLPSSLIGFAGMAVLILGLYLLTVREFRSF